MAGASEKKPASTDRHLAAIYIHAGAGYHSIQNEHVHLKACADAARIAMACLKGGGCALDAAEIAIKTLEDNDVTNAGYGSNLTTEGNVEGDATIVDHYGRSGAVGAIGKVSNPIHAARMVYERSIQPMPLRRVPPNLLVGDGAIDFAHEQGISVLPNECLVSEGARDRFEKWKVDIEIAEHQANMTPRSATASTTYTATLPIESSHGLNEEEQRTLRDFGPAASHNPTIAALANESQAFSPAESPTNPTPLFSPPAESSPSRPNKLRRRSGSRTHADSVFEIQGDEYFGLEDQDPIIQDINLDTLGESNQFVFGQYDLGPRSSQTQDLFGPPGAAHAPSPSMIPAYGEDGTVVGDSVGALTGNFNSGLSTQVPVDDQVNTNSHVNSNTLGAIAGDNEFETTTRVAADRDDNEQDMISDTVGAIAVDFEGRIAAASSSGGIGMKHKGRVGPAALVGIGTAVIPIEDGDQDRTTVACVTSGTGEHMATSLAAGTCAQRLYSSSKLDAKGMPVPCNDDEAMQGFIKKDFMGHPSVRHSTTGGAIGAMAVKKDAYGMWLYFAHNTDSFALASMHSDDREPSTVMSRSSKQGKITTGGRSMRPSSTRIKVMDAMMGRGWHRQNP